MDKTEKKKGFLDRLDNLGGGFLASEGSDPKAIWENAYKKPEYEELEKEGKPVQIVVNTPKFDPSTIILKERK
jgi:hypothetical protein